MTVSFHKFGNFFPGTGDIKDCGAGIGKYHCLNIPLKSGMTDECYERIFEPIMREVVYHFQPNVIVMQCGADSLAHDKLGKFNLTVKGHGNCVRFMKTFGLPMMIIGGGGYTISNVARCWAYETGVCLGKDLSDEIPANDFYQHYAPTYNIHIEPDKNLENRNQREYLETAMIRCLENIRRLEGAPSVQRQDIPHDYFPIEFREKLQTKETNLEFYD